MIPFKDFYNLQLEAGKLKNLAAAAALGAAGCIGPNCPPPEGLQLPPKGLQYPSGHVGNYDPQPEMRERYIFFVEYTPAKDTDGAYWRARVFDMRGSLRKELMSKVATEQELKGTLRKAAETFPNYMIQARHTVLGKPFELSID